MKPERAGRSLSGVLGSARSVLSGIGAPKTTGPSCRGPTPIAIEFGTRSLKVLQLSGSDSRQILRAAEVMTPEELLGDAPQRFAYQAGHLKSVVASLKPKGKRAVCSIPSGFSFVKHVQLPRGNAASMQTSVRLAVATELGCASESIEPRHVVVRDDLDAGRAEVIAMATARSTVDHLMTAVRGAGLEIVGMQPEVLLAGRSLTSLSTGIIDPISTTLCLDMGFGSTKAVVMHGDKVVFARQIEFGGRAMDELLARTLGCSGSAARARRLATSEFGEDSELPEMNEPLEILVDEITTCVRYHSSLFPERQISRAVVTGGESRHMGLCRHLARKLGVSAQSADPVSTFASGPGSKIQGVDFASPQPGWAPVVGLAMARTEL